MINNNTYTKEDLFVRKAVAGKGISIFAGKIAVNTSRGSVDINKQKALELAIAQFECIKCYKAIQTQARAIFRPTNTALRDRLNTLSINGIIVSLEFMITSNNLDTARNIVNAINDFDSTPNYSAELIGNEVHIKANQYGSIVNTYNIVYTNMDVETLFTTTGFFCGQDGIKKEDNILSEAQLEQIFNNISQITGCGYAPLGTKYR